MKNNKPKKVMKKKTKILIRDIIFGAVVVAAIVALILWIVLPGKDDSGESDYAKQHAKLEGHGFLPQWSTNATHHWHDCKYKTCTETIDRGEHTWDDGVFNTEPTPTLDGEIKYTCTTCKRTKTEPITYDQVKWSGTFDEKPFENFTVKQSIVSPYTNPDGSVTSIYEYVDYFFTKDAARALDYHIIDGAAQSGATRDYTGSDAAAKKAIFVDLLKSLLSDISKYDYDKETDIYYAKADTPIKIALDGSNTKDIIAKDLSISFNKQNVNTLCFTYNDGTDNISVSWTFALFGDTIIAK